MSNCLTDLIGIEGCGGAVPPSNLYINRLPGIELKAIDKIATADQGTLNGVWSDIQERAVRKFKSSVNAKFKERWKLKTITSVIDLGRKINTNIIASPEVGLRGFALELHQEGANFGNSNMQSVYVKALSLYLPSPVATTVKLYDLDLAEELFTYDLAGVEGWNTITVNETFLANRIGFVYTSILTDSVQLDISQMSSYLNSAYACCYEFNNGQYRVRGIHNDTDLNINGIQFGDNTFGLTGIFSVICSYDSIVCNNLPVFETALWYLTGAEFCFERRFTSRLNEFTSFDKNKAKELEEEYKKRFDEELGLAIGGINLDGNDSCLVCNSQFMYSDAYL